MAHGVGGSNRDHLANYKPPDGGWGWVVVFASFVIHFIMDGIIYSLGTYLTAFTDNFHVSHGEASLVHSLLPAVTLSTGPIASWFTNTYGCRKTTLIGSAIASLGFFLSFFVKSFYLLYITIGCIVGFGFGLVYVPAIVSVGYYFEKKRSLAIGIAVCGAGVGTFILSPLNRVLEQSYGLQGAFLVKSAIVLNMFVCGCLIRPVPVEPSEIKRAMMRKHQDRIMHSRSQSQSHSAHHQFHLDPVSVDCCSENAASETPVKNSIIAITITDPLSVSKAAKMHDSMPALHLKNKNSSSLKLNSTKSPKSTTDETNKSLLRIESDVSELVQSMPMLNMTATQKAKHDANLLKPSSKMNSALDIMAHIRSLQSIPIYSINDEEMEEEENEETLVEAEANKKKKDELQFKEKTRRFLNRVKGRLNSLVHELDLSLFRDSVFLFFALSNFLTSLGFNTPFIYIVDQATLLKIEPTKADLLLSTIGISNTVGRVILGIISDMKNINRLFLYAALLTCCGIATIVEPFLTTFYALFIYAIVFGITSGGYVSLTSVLLVDLLGLDKLTNAFGILLVFQGIATLLGPPTVGILYDIFNSYNIPFVITGILIGISGFMCFFIPCLKKTPASK